MLVVRLLLGFCDHESTSPSSSLSLVSEKCYQREDSKNIEQRPVNERIGRTKDVAGQSELKLQFLVSSAEIAEAENVEKVQSSTRPILIVPLHCKSTIWDYLKSIIWDRTLYASLF